MGCNKLLAVLRFRRDGGALDPPHETHKNGGKAQSSDHLLFKLAQDDPFGLADCHSFFSNNETYQDVLLYPALVFFCVQLCHCV